MGEKVQAGRVGTTGIHPEIDLNQVLFLIGSRLFFWTEMIEVNKNFKIRIKKKE
jgi:hypothetical protein